MDLSGNWAFQLDPRDRGITEQWYAHPLSEHIQLPGSLQAQGFGDEVSVDTQWTGDIVDRSWFSEERYAPYRQPGNLKVPFWLQPDKVYSGAAWYQREIDIPEEWRHWRVTLTLERAHWATQAWLDGRELGSRDSLSTPHVYDVGIELTPGPHLLTLRVDNRRIVNVGPNASSITDHTQTNWNGIIGQITLSAGPDVRVSDLQVYPDVARKMAHLRVQLHNGMAQVVRSGLTLQARSYNSPNLHLPAPISQELRLDPGETLLEVDYPLGPNAQTWDEFNPALYRLTATLESIPTPEEQPNAPSFTCEYPVTFGLRELGVEGTQFTLNGRKIFIRGTLECSIFPLTGYPPTTVPAWKQIIRQARSYGLNLLRFHSWCPPEAAFQAGDEEGFYFQVEIAAWANQGACVGEGDPLDEWLYAEASRITAAYGNHPSFMFMPYGNEPAGKIIEWLGDWVEYWKARDTRRLYTSAAGWPMLPANQYHNVPEPRIQAWGQGLDSRINALPPETETDYRDFVEKATKPVVSHEIGQWCAFPNFKEIEKYRGLLKAKNFEIFRDSLEAHGMGEQAEDFLIASGKLQVLCYKEDIESALRTPGFAGFHLLDLHDFPGQGTALVGVLDPFWEEKGYVTGAEYSRFCNATVPLARLAKRYWHTGETFHADVDIAHFGAQPLQGVTPTWALRSADGKEVAAGSLPTQDIPLGNATADGQNIRLGSVELPLAGLAAARRYVFSVCLPGVTNPNGQPVENDWDVWVFPETLEASAPPKVLVTSQLDEAALARLQEGGKVLLLLPPEQVKTDAQIGFSSVFWNTTWTRNQPPHTLGLLLNPRQPVFERFPTESHSNWQWWELVHGAAAMQLDDLPRSLRPLVQPIDTWFENRRLGLLFEARAGGGKLMVCSMDLEHDLENRLVARQMRHSLLRYMAGPNFNPRVDLPVEAIQGLLG